MDNLDEIVSRILANCKTTLKPSTFISRQQVFNQLLASARENGIHKPSKELFDSFLKDDHGSKERRSMHFLVLRQIDREASLSFLTPDGEFYNAPDIPSEDETDALLSETIFPLTGKISTSVLISRALSDLKKVGESKSTCAQYLHAFRIFQAFCMKSTGSVDYSGEVCKYFLDENDRQRETKQIKEWRWKTNRKATFVLMEVVMTGHYYWKRISPYNLEFQDFGLERIHKCYMDSINTENFSTATIDLRDYVFRTAISLGNIGSKEALKLLSYENIRELTIKFSEKFCLSSLQTIINIFRSILHWLWDNGYTEKNLAGCVMKPFVQKGHVASYITCEDEETIVSYYENSPLRDKSMALLALKLGMRSKDICNLRFSEIDWHGERIRLHQNKSGEPLILPLTVEVGNAISDYILKERPVPPEPSPYVFLNRNAPYHKLEKIYHLCRKAMDDTNVTAVDSNRKGSHLFRQTMVHRLLEKKVAHQVITDALGHNAKDSDKSYITMEASMLRMCALTLDGIGNKHWEGGINV